MAPGGRVRQGGVLYVAGEGVRGIGRRVRAGRATTSPLLEGIDLPFRLLPASVSSTDPIHHPPRAQATGSPG
jgi:hypothetical protein